MGDFWKLNGIDCSLCSRCFGVLFRPPFQIPVSVPGTWRLKDVLQHGWGFFSGRLRRSFVRVMSFSPCSAPLYNWFLSALKIKTEVFRIWDSSLIKCSLQLVKVKPSFLHFWFFFVFFFCSFEHIKQIVSDFAAAAGALFFTFLFFLNIKEWHGSRRTCEWKQL